MRNSLEQWGWIPYEGAVALSLICMILTGSWKGILLAAALMMVLAPIVGSLSDGKGRKKKSFLISFLSGVLCMQFPALYPLAILGFACAILLHDAFLTDVTDEKQVDEISAGGYACFILFSAFGLWIVTYITRQNTNADLPRILSTALAVVLFVVSLGVMHHKHEALPADRRLLGELLYTMRKTATSMAKNRKIRILMIITFLQTAAIVMVSCSYMDRSAITELRLTSVWMAALFSVLVTLVCGFTGKRSGSITMLIIVTLLTVCGCLMDLIWPGVMIVMTVITCGGIFGLNRAYFSKIIPRDSAAAYFGIFHSIRYIALFCGLWINFLPYKQIAGAILLLISGGILILQRRKLREPAES